MAEAGDVDRRVDMGGPARRDAPEVADAGWAPATTELGDAVVTPDDLARRTALGQLAIRAKSVVGAASDALEAEAGGIAGRSVGQLGVQAKAVVGAADDPLEREADRTADHIMRRSFGRMPEVTVGEQGTARRQPAGAGEPAGAGGVAALHPPAPLVEDGSGGAGGEVRQAGEAEPAAAPGRELPADVRRHFEAALGHDLSAVRIHDDAEADAAARAVNARAFTCGYDINLRAGEYDPTSEAGRRLLAHELAHVLQQVGVAGARRVQRVIMVTTPTTPRHAMLAGEQSAFVTRFIAHADRPLALRVLTDMAAAGDTFDFADEDELRRELVKRVATSRIMQQTQTGAGRTAFGYPFNPPADIYGPRVNFAARAYWTPLPPDGYADRSGHPDAARARVTPRSSRHAVFGDLGGSYEFSLTAAGIADFHQALVQLFVPQPQPRNRSLIHCDYLISLVHFRALAESMGVSRFNMAARAYGADQLKLRWNLYESIYADNFRGFGWSWTTFWHPSRAPAAALASLAEMRPSSIGDLVIGDHVLFWNHPAYDTLNENIGNAWRLENAVLIDRRSGNDVFLGHGSGEKTDPQMRAKLADEYNQVADIALTLVRHATIGSAAARAAAQAELHRRFPNVEEDGGRWYIRAGGIFGFFRSVDQPLRRITASEVPGLRDPTDTSRLYPVRRPHESRR